MRPPLVATLTGALVAATPAGSEAPLDPLHVEISRAGVVKWQGELVPDSPSSPGPVRMLFRLNSLCPGAPNRSNLHVSVFPEQEMRKGRPAEYLYQYSWSRPFDPDPRRLDACDEPYLVGVRSSRQNGAFHLGRRGRVSIALPDDLTITFRR